MKCLKCNSELSDDLKYCPNCGNQLNANNESDVLNSNAILNDDSVNQNASVCLPQQSTIDSTNKSNMNSNSDINGNDSDGDILGIIAIIFLFFFPLGSIVAVVKGRLDYPNNKLLKVAMYLTIFDIAAVIFAFIFFIVACGSCASGLSDMGTIMY